MSSYEPKESAEIVALQFTGTEESALMLRAEFGEKVWPSYGVRGRFEGSIFVATLNGVDSATKDYWVIRAASGNFSVRPPEDFAAEFKPVSVEPK